ncbi:RagB/SusD family nutrient uptake outer membrane protein [Haliscomenobacter sp.]|uniref:RagB/SusD family nutrient uptake outer membrane protein n=1 Tax=Haliscomenobacter sp. TaxID=2717303 RepID=UPI003BA9402F
MRNTFKFFILLFALSMFNACDVDRLPETQLSDPAFWKTEADLTAAANYLYTFLPGLPNTDDNWSDETYARAPNSISDGSRIAPATDGSYNNPYRLIRAANNIIAKGPQAAATGVSAATIDRYIGEAQFFRAWAYFSLLQRYGGVPLILTTLKENSPELEAPAATREAVVEAIYKDLDFAAAKLPTPKALGAAGYGRISNTAALAFKARVALFEGTRSKFHGYGEPNKHLALAVTASKAVIDSKEHGLFGNYYNLFQLAGEGPSNKENILVRKYGVSLADNVLNHNSARNLENGSASPTKSLVDSYLMTDGLPITKSPLYTAPVASIDVFAKRDERLSATIMKRGDAYIGSNPVFSIAPLVFNFTGFCPRKYFNIDDWTNQRSYIDGILIRYAEVLLIYAEAKFELEGSISDADLELSVNLLRTRGKIAKLSNAFVNDNGLDMRTELRRERRVELALEGFRYWDLMRWKTAEVELVKPILGNFFFKSEYGTATSVKLTPDNFILVQDANFRKFNPEKDYLWPLPINEIGLNPSLKQNQGW